MQPKGYITVHWDKLERDVKSVFDKDGDGEVSEEDLRYWHDKVCACVCVCACACVCVYVCVCGFV